MQRRWLTSVIEMVLPQPDEMISVIEMVLPQPDEMISAIGINASNRSRVNVMTF